MCGRYFLFVSPDRLKEIFRTENAVQYNVPLSATPLQFLPLVVRRPNGEMRMGVGRWGLLPSYSGSDDPSLCAQLKNARSETVAEKRSFADRWRGGCRVLVPASGFYEWPLPKVKNHPGFRVTVPGQDLVCFAGLWSKREELVTFTVLTRDAFPASSHVHPRIPVMFSPHDGLRWLGAGLDEAQAMMTASPVLGERLDCILEERKKPAESAGGLFELLDR